MANAMLPTLESRYKTSTARTENNLLILSTGKVEYRLEWTGFGFASSQLTCKESAYSWQAHRPQLKTDWSYPGVFSADSRGTLLSLSAEEGNDDGFTSNHLRVIAEIAYPADGLSVKMEIWLYPDAPGLRHQLWVKRAGRGTEMQETKESISLRSGTGTGNSNSGRFLLRSSDRSAGLSSLSLHRLAPDGRISDEAVARLENSGRSSSAGDAGRIEGSTLNLPIDTTGLKVSAAGYYSDTQNRNLPETPVLRQETLPPSGECGWASLLFIAKKEGGTHHGLTLVKESHKTVQTYGVHTGSFIFDRNGVVNTGWCLTPQEITDEYRWLWASWILLWHGDETAKQSTLRAFDRLRFPTVKSRDMWSVMCTWGHSIAGDGRRYAYEEEVLFEMDHTADMDIDMLLIDDGWQSVAPIDAEKYPQDHKGWYPHPGIYKDGSWRRVVEKARAKNLRLGLWGAWTISKKEMVDNWKELRPDQFKLDFANLTSWGSINALRQKIRDFMSETDHSCMISLDTTEAAPRYGYYSFREFGNVHFMNRKPMEPAVVLYVPWLALRDFWQLAHFQNLNKWQLVIQNPEVVAKERTSGDRLFSSDAYRHSADYCAAMALMGTPEFMGISRHYSEKARKKIRTLLGVHKEVRSEIWDSDVRPIGDMPSNKSWTGFQAVRNAEYGYATLFREIENGENERRMAFSGLQPGQKVHFENLLDRNSWMETADDACGFTFSMSDPGSYLFLRYDVSDS